MSTLCSWPQLLYATLFQKSEWVCFCIAARGLQLVHGLMLAYHACRLRGDPAQTVLSLAVYRIIGEPVSYHDNTQFMQTLNTLGLYLRIAQQARFLLILLANPFRQSVPNQFSIWL